MRSHRPPLSALFSLPSIATPTPFPTVSPLCQPFLIIHQRCSLEYELADEEAEAGRLGDALHHYLESIALGYTHLDRPHNGVGFRQLPVLSSVCTLLSLQLL